MPFGTCWHKQAQDPSTVLFFRTEEDQLRSGWQFREWERRRLSPLATTNEIRTLLACRQAEWLLRWSSRNETPRRYRNDTLCRSWDELSTWIGLKRS